MRYLRQYCMTTVGKILDSLLGPKCPGGTRDCWGRCAGCIKLRIAEELRDKRREYADHLVACCDTVTLLRCDEVAAIHARAVAGEFDADLNWRSPHLRVIGS